VDDRTGAPPDAPLSVAPEEFPPGTVEGAAPEPPPAYPPSLDLPPPSFAFAPPEPVDDRDLVPWVHIWTRPRAVVRSIVRTDPLRGSWFLPLLSGLLQGIFFGLVAAARAEEQFGFNHALVLPFGLALGVVFAPLLSVLFLNLNALLVQWTGEWLGGRGDFVTVRAGLAWALVPGVWAALLWLPRLALLGGQAFLTEPLNLEGDIATGAFLTFLGLCQIVIGVWACAILCKCIGEAHGFSAWRGLWAQVLALLIPAIAVGLLAAAGLAIFMGRG
jgi:hypothetical protein